MNQQLVTPKRRSYWFDFDSNLLFTNSLIYLLKKENHERKEVTVTQEDYDNLTIDAHNYRYIQDNVDLSMREFRQAWMYKKALLDALASKHLGPSREKFEEATSYANPLSIITARGQSPDELKEWHKIVIMDYLLQEHRGMLLENMMHKMPDLKRKSPDAIIDYYLQKNLYLPVSSKSFLAQFPWMSAQTIAQRKNIGFAAFVRHAQQTFLHYDPNLSPTDMQFSIWFSDDSIRNISSLEHYIEHHLLYDFPKTKFVLYNTANPACIKKTILLPTHFGQK